MLAGEGAVAIWNDIAEAGRAEFYAWHLHEHMPERVGIPGFVRGRRYRAADAATQPEFFTLYETLSFQVIQGSDYLARLNEPTDWTRAATAHFQSTTRSLTRVVASHGVGSGGAMLTLRFDIADDAVHDLVPRVTSALEAAARLPRITGAHLLGSDACGDPWFERELTAYFPEPLRDGRFAAARARHPLRREIIAARVTNLLVDRAGTSFIHRLTEETGAGVPELALAHDAAWEIFGLEALWSAVEVLDNVVPAATQIDMMLPIRRLAERASRWLVRHGPQPLDVAAAVAAFGEGAGRLAGLLPTLLSAGDREAADGRAAAWVDAGAGKDLAVRVAGLDALAPALDVIQVAGGPDALPQVAAVYFDLGTALELDWLRDRIAALPRDDRWQALARSALGDDYARERAAVTAEAISAARGMGGVPPTTAAGAAKDSLDAWMDRHRPAVERFLLVVDDIRSGLATPDLATLSVAMREARALTTAGG